MQGGSSEGTANAAVAKAAMSMRLYDGGFEKLHRSRWFENRREQAFVDEGLTGESFIVGLL